MGLPVIASDCIARQPNVDTNNAAFRHVTSVLWSTTHVLCSTTNGVPLMVYQKELPWAEPATNKQMHECVYVYTYIYMYMCVYVYIYELHLYIYVHIYIYICVYVYV